MKYLCETLTTMPTTQQVFLLVLFVPTYQPILFSSPLLLYFPKPNVLGYILLTKNKARAVIISEFISRQKSDPCLPRAGTGQMAHSSFWEMQIHRVRLQRGMKWVLFSSSDLVSHHLAHPVISLIVTTNSQEAHIVHSANRTPFPNIPIFFFKCKFPTTWKNR